MLVFFYILNFLKDTFIKDYKVKYIPKTADIEKSEKIYNFTLRLDHRVNSFDRSIVSIEYKLVESQSDYETSTSFYDIKFNSNVRKVCKKISENIYLCSGVKINPKKLFKSIKYNFRGKVIIDGITIEIIDI